MQAYLGPLKTAMMIFPFLALFISAFFFIHEYRKYGRFLVVRGIIMYSFVFYLLCAYLLVILPLPPIDQVAQLTGPTMELQFGASLQHFLQQTVLNIKDPATYLPAMKQSVFLEPVFNILLLIPFGVYLRYFFNLSWTKTLLASFGLSLFFELTQLTGLYFIYPRSYRLFDVNDLFHNTLGGMLGFWLEPLLTFLLPSRSELDEEAYEKGHDVTLIRRLAAFLIDWGIITFSSVIIEILARLVTGNYKLDFVDSGWWYFVTVFGYFMLLPRLTNGKTPGKALVKIRIAEVDREQISFWALFKRYGILYFFYGGYSHLLQEILPLIRSDNHFLTAISTGLSLVGLLLSAGFAATIIWSFVKRKRRLFYERSSKTYTISTVKPKES